MSQTTLLQFFKAKNADSKRLKDDAKPPKTDTEIRSSDEDSPVKAVRKSKKRNRISSSDSESDHSSNEQHHVRYKNSPQKKLCTEKVEKQKSPSFKNQEEDSKTPNAKGNKKSAKEQTVKDGKNNTLAVKSTEKKEPYNPNVPNYDPIANASWDKNEKVPYLALARTLEEIENESARLKMTGILSNYLRSVIVLSPEDMLPSVYLCLNKFGPAHEGVELGLAEQTLIRAISQSTGRTVSQVRNESQEVGDLGIVAERSRSCQKLMIQPAALTVSGVYKKCLEIAKMTGQAAINKKITTIRNLYVSCRGPEAKFLIRSLNGKLRIGIAESSVLQAIALACAMTPPGQDYPPEILDKSKSKSSESFKAELDELALILKTTYCECPDYGLIIPALLKDGIRSLPERCKITPGLPMKPMLAQPTKGVEEVFSRFEGLEFTCEWKYDGERAQIHATEDGTIKIFSRNQEDNTSKYPDIISRINNTKKDNVKSFILDCEAVAWDAENKGILPFQVLSMRKRKNVSAADIEVPVCVFMFDLLYLNNKPLVKECLYERRRLLRENFQQVYGQWMFASSIDSSEIDEIQEFLEESFRGNCEGLMVKTLKDEATYEIAKRSRNWLKLKKDYLEGVGDTLDLVVVGGYLGKGKRAGNYGGFLLACYDDNNDEYQSVCKLGTGFSDEFLASSTEFFKPHIIPKAPSYYQHDSSLEPDHWFSPVRVWEIKCADLSLSPVHKAGIGLVDPEKGISLRFPRFLRIREDKKPEQGTTTGQVIVMYNSQEQVKNQRGKKPKFNEEDFY